MKKTTKRTQTRRTRVRALSLISIILILFPFTGILSLERLIYAKNKVPGIIRFVLGLFFVFGFILWIVDIVLLILGRYMREAFI